MGGREGYTSPTIIAGDDVTVYDGFDSLTEITEITGATVFQEGIRVHNNFRNYHPNYQGRMPFHASAIQNLLSQFDLVLLVGGQFFEEVWFDAENTIPENTDALQIESSARQLEQNFSVSYGKVSHIGKTLKHLSESLIPSKIFSSRNQ